MTAKSIQDLSQHMRKMDFCILSTREAGGGVSSRPMSNNGDVEFDGDVYFFSFENTRKVAAIDVDPAVTVSFSAPPSLLGKPGIFIVIEGHATLIRDKAAFAEHWTRDLEIWFTDGIDTPGLVLLKVHARRIEFWDGDENAVVAVPAGKTG